MYDLLKKRGSGIIPFVEERYASAYYQMVFLGLKPPVNYTELTEWMLKNREQDERKYENEKDIIENVLWKIQKFGITNVLVPFQIAFIEKKTKEKFTDVDNEKEIFTSGGLFESDDKEDGY